MSASEAVQAPPFEAAGNEEHNSTTTTTTNLVCFACSRCDYPLCVGVDLIMKPIPGGTTDYAFDYELDCLLDLDEPVPCYSGNEVVQTLIRVSEKVLNQPLPPAARVVALEAIVASRQYEEAQRHKMEALLHAPSQADPFETSSPPPVAPTVSSVTGHEHDQRLAASVEAPTARVTATGELIEEEGGEEDGAAPPAQTQAQPPTVTPQQQQQPPRVPLYERLNAPIRHLGATSESRVDLVCVHTSLLASGLRLSLEDRSADNPQAFTESAAAIAAASAEDAARQKPLAYARQHHTRPDSSSSAHADTAPPAPTSDNTATSHGVSSTPYQVPQALLDVAMQSGAPTQWADTPGNLSVNEAFMTVTRSTHTAQAPWFSAYNCERRVECPDCHLPLGFLFVRKPESDESDDSNNNNSDSSAEDKNTAHTQDAQALSEEPATKKNRLEEGKTSGERVAAAVATRDGVINATSELPDFIALELKRIKQRGWGLSDFQERYEKAQHLDTFRALFPEAEELQSLYSRLTALRTQTELYSNLLRKHREQNDVQTALLQSQKQRMQTYDEKLRTMQQIIDAQRRQLEMQTTQLEHQQDLLRSHRQQLNSQQQQISVEQLLIAEQTKTIETQREQIHLMRAHLDTRRLQEQINEKKLELIERMQRAYPNGERTVVSTNPISGATVLSMQPAAVEKNTAPAVESEDTASAPTVSPAITQDAPPAHLRGIRDQGQQPAAARAAVTTAPVLARRWPQREDALGGDAGPAAPAAEHIATQGMPESTGQEE